MKPIVPHSRPRFSGADVRAVVRVVRSGQLACGPEVARLEGEFAARFGFAHAVAVSSGSAALHLALLALGARPGKRVVLPSYVCAAPLNAVRHSGARERLVDCEPGGFHLDVQAARRAARGAAAIVLPHLFGAVAAARGLAAAAPLIEDCAMALGAATPGGAPPGHAGVAAVYSFYATKPAGAGEGGLVATDDPALAHEVRDLRSYDMRPDWRLRFNFKMTDLVAALVRSRLRRLDRSVAERRRLAGRYRAALAGSGLTLPDDVPGHSWYRFVVRDARGFARLEPAFARARVRVARPVHCPLHRLLGLPAAGFPEAEARFLTALSLPLYPGLTAAEQQRVIEVLRRP